MKQVLTIVAGLLMAPFGGNALAACMVTAGGTTVQMVYDPFVPTDAAKEFSVSLNFSPDCGEGNAIVYFEDTEILPSPGRIGSTSYSAPYDISRAGGGSVLRLSPVGSAGFNLPVTSPQTQSLTFRFAVPAGQKLAAAARTITLVTIAPDGVSTFSVPVTLDLALTEQRRLYLAGASTSGLAQFVGPLMPGQSTSPVMVFPQSTGPFRISVQSENNGLLRHWGSDQYLGGSADSDRTFRYTLQLGGQSLSEATPFIDSTDYGLAPMNPASSIGLSLLATVDAGQNPSQRRAGEYRDTVTLLIEPKP
jgi:hypothetical protein